MQETVSSLKAESLKTQIGVGTELQVSIWHSRTRKAFLMHVGSAMDAIKKQGHFKAHEEAHEAYMEQRNLVKQAKAALAELDGTTSKGAGASKKSSKKFSKKHKEAALWLMHLNLTGKLFINWTSRRPKNLHRMPGPRWNQLLRTCSSSMQTCWLWMLSTHGTRTFKSRHNPIPAQTYKVYPRKDLGDSRALYLMTA